MHVVLVVPCPDQSNKDDEFELAADGLHALLRKIRDSTHVVDTEGEDTVDTMGKATVGNRLVMGIVHSYKFVLVEEEGQEEVWEEEAAAVEV